MRKRKDRSLILLLDENLSGHRIIAGLTALNIPIKPQTDIMKRGVSDEEVLQVLSLHLDCFLLTRDSDFHMKPMIREAVVQHGVGAFVITAHKGKTAPELVELIGAAWGRIQKFVRSHRRPFVAKILSDGRVERGKQIS